MPFPILPVVAVLVLAGGGVGAYFAVRRRSPAFGAVPSQQTLDEQVLVAVAAKLRLDPIAAKLRLDPIAAKLRLDPIAAEVAAEKAKNPPRYTIDEANGWTATWLHKAESAKLEWGFCLWDLKEAQTDAQMYDDSRFAKMVGGLIQRAVSWVIDRIGVVTGDISICYRIELPAVRFELADGRSFWVPSEPEGGSLTDIQGWNPGTSRPGFPGRLGKWPLARTPPAGEGGALWIRPLGDFWGWGTSYNQPVEVYQIIADQGGVLKSMPAMSRRDWRIALMLGGEMEAGGTIWPGGVAEWFKDWRMSGQGYKMRPATRKKAMGMFES